jgi:outer membrane protein
VSILKTKTFFPALGLGLATLAFAQSPCTVPTKVGIISMADALAMTKEGQKAGTEMQAKFQPKKDGLDKRGADIQAKQAQLAKGRATMSADAQAKLQGDIDSATKVLNRDMEDAQSEADEEKNKILNALGEKMMGILGPYSQDNCYAVILDVSQEQTSVLWAASAANVTADMIKLYDEKFPVAAGAAAAPAAAPAGAKPAGVPAGPSTVARPGAPTTPPATTAPPSKKQ